MKFLVSNDDGYLAPGIAALVEVLSDFGQVTVIAPESEQSGASHSLTLKHPLAAQLINHQDYFINGTPTDCVHLALTSLLKSKPDFVFSGINHGANLGDDTLYSGTVAAAIEGFLFGIPSVAISITGKSGQHLPTAQAVVKTLIQRLIKHPVKKMPLLNVNIPDIPLSELRGIKATRLGRRHPEKSASPMKGPRGHTVYWIGEVAKVKDANIDTDFWACENGFASVTPLTVDLTAASDIPSLNSWLSLP